MKEKIYNHCLQLLENKIVDLRSVLASLKESASNETKSSAGDKHETARAMMQLEQEKTGNQLKEAEEQKAELQRINLTKKSDTITKGTLIKSDKGFLFLSIGLGKISIEGETVFCVSPKSPLGIKLIGRKENERAEINGVRYFIEKLY